MTNRCFKFRICFLTTLTLANMLVAQQKSSSPSANSPAATPAGSSQPAGGTGGGGASSGTYSIEGEIFAYKSLQLNGKTIAQDVTTLIPTTSSSTRPGVVIVPSTSAILPAFQLWRSNILVIQNFLNQAEPILPKAGAAPCSAQIPPKAGPPSFGVYATGVTEAVGAIQSILSLFASSQSVMEFSGTIQDQALVSAVSRELRANQVQVLAPDIFAPWTIDIATPPDSPFVSKLAKLIDDLSRLQDVYQCSQLTLGVGSQLQQAEITREADFAKLKESSLKDPDRTAAINEIRNLTSQIANLRLRLGLDVNAANITDSEKAITTAEQTLNDPKSSDAQKALALDTIKKSDAEIMALENPIIVTASLTAAKAQSLVTGIQGYLAGLTGGAVSFTPPAASTSVTPTGSGTASQAPAPAVRDGAASATAPSATAAEKTTGDSASASASPTVSSPTSSTPPIVTILQADGLARKMNVRQDKENWNFSVWRILWVKSMESGGAIVTESNIWGSKPYFSGGAVSGYALFQLDGTLVCSGNAAAYGGYVKPKDFVKSNSSVGAVEMLHLGSGCKPDGTKSEPEQ